MIVRTEVYLCSLLFYLLLGLWLPMLVRLQNGEEGCSCVSLNLDGHKWYTVMGRK